MFQRGSHHRGNSRPVYQPIRKMGSGTTPRFCLTQQGTDRGTESKTELPAWTVSRRSERLAVARFAGPSPSTGQPTRGIALPSRPNQVFTAPGKTRPAGKPSLNGESPGDTEDNESQANRLGLQSRLPAERPLAVRSESVRSEAVRAEPTGQSQPGRANRAHKSPRIREAADDVQPEDAPSPAKSVAAAASGTAQPIRPQEERRR